MPKVIGLGFALIETDMVGVSEELISSIIQTPHKFINEDELRLLENMSGGAKNESFPGGPIPTILAYNAALNGISTMFTSIGLDSKHYVNFIESLGVQVYPQTISSHNMGQRFTIVSDDSETNYKATYLGACTEIKPYDLENDADSDLLLIEATLLSAPNGESVVSEAVAWAIKHNIPVTTSLLDLEFFEENFNPSLKHALYKLLDQSELVICEGGLAQKLTSASSTQEAAAKLPSPMVALLYKEQFDIHVNKQAEGFRYSTTPLIKEPNGSKEICLIFGTFLNNIAKDAPIDEARKSSINAYQGFLELTNRG